jgi:hypothetical protein
LSIQGQSSDKEQLLATAAEMQTMAELIGRYPAEAQLIMAALEDGLTLGHMQLAGRITPEAAPGGTVG